MKLFVHCLTIKLSERASYNVLLNFLMTHAETAEINGLLTHDSLKHLQWTSEQLLDERLKCCPKPLDPDLFTEHNQQLIRERGFLEGLKWCQGDGASTETSRHERIEGVEHASGTTCNAHNFDNVMKVVLAATGLDSALSKLPSTLGKPPGYFDQVKLPSKAMLEAGKTQTSTRASRRPPPWFARPSQLGSASTGRQNVVNSQQAAGAAPLAATRGAATAAQRFPPRRRKRPASTPWPTTFRRWWRACPPAARRCSTASTTPTERTGRP